MNAYEVRPKKTDKSEAKYQAHQIILTLDLTVSKFDDHLRILNLEIQGRAKISWVSNQTLIEL